VNIDLTRATGQANTVSGSDSGILIGNASTATINNRGYTISGRTAVAGLNSTDSSIVINNLNSGGVRGVIASTDGPTGTAIQIDAGGPGIITNEGDITGRYRSFSTLGTGTFSNLPGGLWTTVGVSAPPGGLALNAPAPLATAASNSMGGNIATLVNAGTIRTSLIGAGGPVVTSFVPNTGGTLTWTNSGTLTMENNVTGDAVLVGGNFTGAPGSTVRLDTFLGGPGSGSDLLRVTAATSGATSLAINNTNPGFGAYNPNGIPVVSVNGGTTSATHFTLTAGTNTTLINVGGRQVIPAGWFFYDLALRPDNVHVLSGLPSQEVLQLPRVNTAAQAIWYDSMYTWLERQVDLRDELLRSRSGVVLSRGETYRPSAWVRTSGSFGSSSQTSGFTNFNNAYSFDVGIRQNTGAILAGADVERSDVIRADDRVVFGLFAGYLTSNVSFGNSRSRLNFEGVTLGGSATYMTGSFFVDAMLKVDVLNVDYRFSPSGNSVSGGLDGVNFGGMVDAGYRFQVRDRMFVEPLATLAYMETSLDGFQALGSSIDFGVQPSLRGSLGLRVGGEVGRFENIRLDASLTGRIWHEFDSNNSATITSGGPSGQRLQVRDGTVGTYGELGGQVNVLSETSSFNGFVGGSVRFHGDYTSSTVRAGVRYTW
jgi:outer membrane autotransporter protein